MTKMDLCRSTRLRSGRVWLVASLASLVPAVAALAQPFGPSKVSVAPVESRVFHPEVIALGRIESPKRSRVSTEVEGLVAEVAVDEGDRVSEGDVLLGLSTSLLEIRRRRAEAELALARKQLEEYRAGTREEEIREAEAALASAEALLEQARLDRQRYEGLEGTDAYSEDELSDARALERSRRALKEREQAVLDRLRSGPRIEVIERAESEVAIREAALDEIVDQLEKATIRAPFRGVVTEKTTEVGSFVRPGDELFTLVQLDPVRAVLAVAEAALYDVSVGQEASIRVAASPSVIHGGKITALIPSTDPVAGTFPVKVRLPNPEGRLLPGMGVRGRISGVTLRTRLAVPSDALADSPGGTVVFVVRDDKAERVPVRTGLREEGLVEIEGDLGEGELVVVLGNETLRPGSPVVIVPAGPGRGGSR